MELDPALLGLVRKGVKRSTVRKGLRDLKTGEELTLADSLGNRVSVVITDVMTKRVCELTEAEARRDGARSLNDLLRMLAAFYGELRPQDTITIVGFRLGNQG